MTNSPTQGRGRLIIVAGLPATGKTTRSLELERRLPAVRLSADDWMIELGIDLLDAAARARIEQLQWAMGQRLLEYGALVIVEWGTWSRSDRDALRERARIESADTRGHRGLERADRATHRRGARAL